MAQYYTRIHLKVKESGTWKKLLDIDMSKYGFPCSAQDVFSIKRHSLILDDFPLEEEDLKAFVSDVSGRIRGKGVIIADTTNVNVNPYTYCVYSMSSKVKEALYEEPDDRCEMFEAIGIDDIAQWLAYGRFEIGPTERKMLSAVNVRIQAAKKEKKPVVKETEEEKAARLEREREQFKLETLRFMDIFPDKNGLAMGEGEDGPVAYDYFGDETTLTIPNGTVLIFYKGFTRLKTVEVLVLPEGLRSIDAGCFWGCERLTEAHIPASCTDIGEYAFLDCPKLSIMAPRGSYAEEYAKENNIPFIES